MSIIAFLFLAGFAIIAWRSYRIALALFFFLLPTYLIRFHLGPLPTTLLELMLFILCLVGIVVYCKIIIPTIKGLLKQHPSLGIAILLFLGSATVSIFTAIDLLSALGEWRAFYVEPVILFGLTILALTNKPITKNKNQSNPTINNQQSTIDNETIEPWNNRTIEQSTNIILFALILSGLITSLFAIYQHFTGFYVPHAFWANRDTYRVTGWYGFPNAVGLMLAPLVPIAMYLAHNVWQKIKELPAISSQQSHKQLYWVILATSLLFTPSSILAVIYAKSTGGLIGIAAGIGTLLLFYKKTRLPALITGIAGLATILFILSPTNPIRQEILAQDRSGQLRRDIWAETAELLIARPMTGAGIASYEERIAPYRIQKNIEVFHHPHNLFLTMWVNIGLIGLIGFVWVIVWFYRVGLMQIAHGIKHKTFPQNNLTALSYQLTAYLVASMTTILVTGLVDSPYIKNDLSIFFWFIIALMYTEQLEPQ